MKRPWRYILIDRVPIPEPSLMKWAGYMETADRKVRRDERGGVVVSTVFLGLDHQYGDGPPLLFETMVFGGHMHEYCERCTTYDQAEAQHADVVDRAYGDNVIDMDQYNVR